MPEVEFNPLDFEELQKSEWSEEFETLMRNRLLMGAFRYGRLHDPDKPNYNRMKGIISHLVQYEHTHNKEHLVDIANIALCEFAEGSGWFLSIDDGQHVPQDF
jgi:hypothetical protein